MTAAVTLVAVAAMVTVLGLKEKMVMDKEEIYVPIRILHLMQLHLSFLDVPDGMVSPINTKT